MKSKKLIIVLAILLVGIIGLTTAMIRAWLTDTEQTDETIFTVGAVQYEWSGAVIAAGYIVPGQNLIATGYTLTNASTIASELRVKINVTSSFLVGDATSVVNITLATGWVDGTDGYWYYRGTEATMIDEGGGVIKYSIPAGIQALSVVTGLSLNGALVGNEYSNSTFTINLAFEAKQKDYVTWAELGAANIDFATGLVAE